MTHRNIENEYFDWMCHLVNTNRYNKGHSYRTLLLYLANRDFTFLIDRDSNRDADGRDLRYRFAYDNNYDIDRTVKLLDRGRSSILEMMVALSLRCEESIMSDPDEGDRTGEWFWEMIFSLGLIHMDDNGFDGLYVDEVIDRFLTRTYRRNGEGGLFTIEHCKEDMRKVEIWYQMNWYLNTIL